MDEEEDNEDDEKRLAIVIGFRLALEDDGNDHELAPDAPQRATQTARARRCRRRCFPMVVNKQVWPRCCVVSVRRLIDNLFESWTD